jgi:hypothetical protein
MHRSWPSPRGEAVCSFTPNPRLWHRRPDKNDDPTGGCHGKRWPKYHLVAQLHADKTAPAFWTSSWWKPVAARGCSMRNGRIGRPRPRTWTTGRPARNPIARRSRSPPGRTPLPGVKRGVPGGVRSKAQVCVCWKQRNFGTRNFFSPSGNSFFRLIVERAA